MKHLLSIVLTIALLLSALGFLGCASRGTKTPETTSPDERFSSELMALIDAPEATYTLGETTFTQGDITIEHPVLQGDNMETVNQVITTSLTELADSFLEDWPSLVLPVTTEVTLQNEKIISMVFTGEGNFEGAAHPFSLFYTLNIAIEDAKKISLGDFQPLDKEFIDLALTYPKTGTATEAVEGSKEYLHQALEDDTLGGMDRVGDNVFSYFTPKAVGLSLPTIHALGDHLEFEIPYEK